MTARDVLDLVWLLPALPALGAVVLLLLGKRLGEPAAGWLATGLAALSFLGAVTMFGALVGLPGEERAHVAGLWTWMQAGGLDVRLGFLVDPLSITMALFVTGVGSLIHLYSIGYMHGDERFSRFFAYLNLFLASMLVLVLGDSFLVTFLGWEGVGLCSYLLISFWFERPSAAVAGQKAFITNRVGDFGFMLAMFLVFTKLGTLDYSALPTATAHVSQGVATGIALLLFLGAVGKSAQLPLFLWLPDAMEGPTPVSALIHAATMVTAGVFLVARAHVFFDVGSAGEVVAWVGAITALFAATVAVAQNDIKRVLAYSTISQLGYMFLAAGVGAYGAAVFHMVTHAFFKALLFLGAGAVIHGLSDEQDMRRMGGLRRYLPVTTATFVVGWLAIAGIFPFAGFWSKDEILAKAWFAGDYGLWVVGAAAAVLTAFYMTRQVWLVFYGRERFHDVPVVAGAADDGPPGSDAAAPAAGEVPAPEPAGIHPHEAPATMTVPLVVLAALAAVGGFLSLPFSSLEFLVKWLEPVFADVAPIEASSFSVGLALSTIALAIAVVGVVVAARVYRRGLADDGTDPGLAPLGPVARVLDRAYYLDDAWARFVSGPGTRAFRFVADGIDVRGIDGVVNGIARAFRGGGGVLRRAQTGLVRNYALAIVLGAVLLLAWFATRVAL